MRHVLFEYVHVLYPTDCAVEGGSQSFVVGQQTSRFVHLRDLIVQISISEDLCLHNIEMC
jgi:hypothetical protein